jgi:hypothetical protein
MRGASSVHLTVMTRATEEASTGITSVAVKMPRDVRAKEETTDPSGICEPKATR